MMRESETVEFKVSLTQAISKEVIAFANTDGGTILLGVDDSGRVVGLTDPEAEYERLTNIIRDTILPDVTMFVRYESLEGNGIKIIVGEGCAKPYYLARHGMKPSGVFVRQGSSSVQATWQQIRQFIKIGDGPSYETKRSLLQDLTFEEAAAHFAKRGVEFSRDTYKALGICDAEKELYTNLGLLVCDQCIHTTKIAVFSDPANTVFLDRREFTGSVFTQLHHAFEYIMLNNRTVSTIRALDRHDMSDYPEEALREALVNALIHRDYSFGGSIIVNINARQMEFISLGGLVAGLSSGDILNGISLPRNPHLAQLFFRLRHIEAYGTGLRRIFSLYGGCPEQPSITVTENSFRLTLPNMNYAHEAAGSADVASERPSRYLGDQMQVVLDYLTDHEEADEETVMELLSVKRTRAYLITRQMADMGLLRILGRGKGKKYVRSGR